MLLTYKENVHSTQMYIPLKPLFSRHKGIGVQFTDEPTGNLDSKSCRAVIDAFLKARDTMQATVFMVTHDSFAASFCDRVIILKDGQVSGIRENRGDRKAFMDELLDTIRVLGGDFDDNE